jgi:hypothetical protein
MKKWLAFVGLIFFATPAGAIDLVDLVTTQATRIDLSITDSRTLSAPIGGLGSVYRFNCTVECFVAVSITDGQGTHGFANGVTSEANGYMHLPANETAYHVSRGQHFIIGKGASNGKLYITVMSR